MADGYYLDSPPGCGDLPHSSACDRNKDPILAVLRTVLRGDGHVLEIGSGTGQHAVYFAQQLPRLRWQCSDRETESLGLAERIRRAALPNLPPPLVLDALSAAPESAAAAAGPYDAVFTANTLHIVNGHGAGAIIRAAGRLLRPGGLLLVYGPFRYRGQYTSAGNAEFDAALRQRGEGSALRELEWVDALAREAGLRLVADRALPANNQLVTWRRETSGVSAAACS